MAKSEDTGIIVLGANGRMGKTITALVLNDPNLRIAGLVDNEAHMAKLAASGYPAAASLDKLPALGGNEVIIDFSAPDASIKAAKVAAGLALPMVIGTTGFDETQKNILRDIAQKNPLLWSANMSIGVNALLNVLPELSRALGPDYDLEIVEVHHKHKKDAPSGTALMLGDALADSRGWKLAECRNSCREGIIGERPEKEIGIQALRGGDVVGIHTCYFFGPGEIISVTHQAESRENFARGALRAALWLRGQRAGKLYNMADVLGFSSHGKA